VPATWPHCSSHSACTASSTASSTTWRSELTKQQVFRT
jgi:hypothetical protein